MTKRISVSNTRIIDPDTRGRARAPNLRPTRTLRPTATARDEKLSMRLATPSDLAWILSWAAQLGLPAPRTRRVRSIVLLQDGQRVGHMGVREGVIETTRGREPVMWIISAFLVPSARHQGLMVKFGELLSRDFFPSGKIGAHIASDNTRVLKLMHEGGWQKIRTAGKYIEYMLEIKSPFRASH